MSRVGGSIKAKCQQMENAHEEGSNLELRLFQMARHGTRRTTTTGML
jgi:hypothetical protein